MNKTKYVIRDLEEQRYLIFYSKEVPLHTDWGSVNICRNGGLVSSDLEIFKSEKAAKKVVKRLNKAYKAAGAVRPHLTVLSVTETKAFRVYFSQD